VDLAPHAWTVPDDPDATPRRFALLSEVASGVPILSLTAGPGDEPAVIADALIDTLPSWTNVR
jgi:hypothetical protein